MENNYVLDNATHKFKTEYLIALLAISPLAGYFAFTFLIDSLSLDFGLDYYVLSKSLKLHNLLLFSVSTICSFITYGLVNQYRKDNQLSVKDVFNSKSKFWKFALYSIVVFILSSITLSIVGEINFDLIYELTKPFGDFIYNAETYSGLIVRLLISLNIIMFFVINVMFVFAHKFILIPYYIVEGEGFMTAFSKSFISTTPFTKLILRSLNGIYLRGAIAFNIVLIFLFFMIRFNPESLITIRIFQFLFVSVLFAYVLPFGYTVTAEIFTQAK